MNKEIAECLINWDEHEEEKFFEEVTKAEIYDRRRWHVCYFQVFKDTRDETFWEVTWSRGATETQDEGPEDVSVYEVVPTEVTQIVYRRKPKVEKTDGH